MVISNVYRSFVWNKASFTVIPNVYRPFIQNKKLHSLRTVLLSGFQSSWELWNPLSKAAPDKFHGSGGHSNHNCLLDQANFYRSRAWQIVLIFNTASHNPTETNVNDGIGIMVITGIILYIFAQAMGDDVTM